MPWIVKIQEIEHGRPNTWSPKNTASDYVLLHKPPI